MKQKITAIALLACMLLCGCEGGRSDSSETESPVTGTTAAEIVSADDVTETASGNTDKNTETSTAAKKSTETPQRETQPRESAESTDADIAIDVPATAKQTDVGNPETVKPESAAVQQTTATATTSSGESFAGSDGILKDDGLDWSPLVPVN